MSQKKPVEISREVLKKARLATTICKHCKADREQHVDVMGTLKCHADGMDYEAPLPFDDKQARKDLKESASRLYPAYRYTGSRWEESEGKLDRFVCTFEYSRWADWKHTWATKFRKLFGNPTDPQQGAEGCAE